MKPRCEGSSHGDWRCSKFGDGSSATGNTVKHTYSTEGQFRVEATCKDEDGKSIKSVITIVVIGQTIVVPGRPTGDQTVVIPGPINGNPGQKPGQQPGQKPGQQPGQKPGQVPRQQAG